MCLALNTLKQDRDWKSGVNLHSDVIMDQCLDFAPLPPAGASVVVILLHAVAMAIPEQIMDEEVGVVMEDISAS